MMDATGLMKASAAEDIPWYTTAAGATGGVMAGKKFLPKKYQGIGQIGGALLGTAAGLGVGKPLAKKFEKKAEDLDSRLVGQWVAAYEKNTGNRMSFRPSSYERMKKGPAANTRMRGDLAKWEKKAEAEESKPPHPALTAAKTVGGLGVGMLAGYGGMKAVDAGLQKVRGRGLPKGSPAMWAVPLAAGAGGLAYSHLQQRTLDKMREDHLKRQEMKRGSQDS